MKIDIKNYKHISFDLWLTLIKSNSEFKTKRNKLFKDFFEIEADEKTVADKIRYYDLACNNINEKTGLNIDTFEIYSLILNSLNHNYENISFEKLNDYYIESELLLLNYKPVLMYSDLKKYLKTIQSEGKTMNLLSNTAFIKGYTLRKIISFYELDDFFSFQIYSDECGFSKPNYKIFELVYNEVNKIELMSKSAILHVGDNKNADYNGAKNYGFDALLINN
ncbi:HAD family hydrolase [Flavobacterium sp. UBA7680]|uniref:HAD family hydrolase n=1 Tax=Flavobacterium sp. UBA7680 TaxID=1946559 RepID=UPI0025BD3C89|nr:HAD family hydrolase [Flavobacterium sp. UBA7680]